MKQFGKTISALDIEAKLNKEASTIVWGMALGATLRWMRDAVQRDFPPSNGLVNIADRAAADERIFASTWWQQWQPILPIALTRPAVEAELTKHHTDFDQHLKDGAFVTEFAGKELLDRIFSWLTNGCDKRVRKDDLIKRVGRVQRETGRLPKDIAQLEQILI